MRIEERLHIPQLHLIVAVVELLVLLEQRLHPVHHPVEAVADALILREGLRGDAVIHIAVAPVGGGFHQPIEWNKALACRPVGQHQHSCKEQNPHRGDKGESVADSLHQDRTRGQGVDDDVRSSEGLSGGAGGVVRLAVDNHLGRTGPVLIPLGGAVVIGEKALGRHGCIDDGLISVYHHHLADRAGGKQIDQRPAAKLKDQVSPDASPLADRRTELINRLLPVGIARPADPVGPFPWAAAQRVEQIGRIVAVDAPGEIVGVEVAADRTAPIVKKSIIASYRLSVPKGTQQVLGPAGVAPLDRPQYRGIGGKSDAPLLIGGVELCGRRNDPFIIAAVFIPDRIPIDPKDQRDEQYDHQQDRCHRISEKDSPQMAAVAPACSFRTIPHRSGPLL